jgi:transposase
MKLYKNFLGIDIGKFQFVTAVYGEKKTTEYDNNEEGIKKFISDYKGLLTESLCILETTGGYEMQILLELRRQNYAVHRANTRKVKHFICSYGNSAKTDALDAKALALYGAERHEKLEIYVPLDEKMQELYELMMRRQDLKQMLVAEKNRSKGPRAQRIKASCEKIIKSLSEEIDLITEQINKQIENDEILNKKRQILKEIPGIGDVVSAELLILLPELGALSRREIASLVGLAPKARDSGKYRGYRATGYGRNGIKPSLYLAAMAARNSKSSLKAFYEQLINRGKKRMVALVALARKIIVIANAKIRDLNAELAKTTL